jgi:hypothetical protein
MPEPSPQSNSDPERCPWCPMPPSEHETRDGILHRVWTCEYAPPGWLGVFTDQPVERHHDG